VLPNASAGKDRKNLRKVWTYEGRSLLGSGCSSPISSTISPRSPNSNSASRPPWSICPNQAEAQLHAGSLTATPPNIHTPPLYPAQFYWPCPIINIHPLWAAASPQPSPGLQSAAKTQKIASSLWTTFPHWPSPRTAKWRPPSKTPKKFRGSRPRPCIRAKFGSACEWCAL